ncbi:MAG TPA: ShlB/FhaC/HecB family hemolysin secretion/activation protein [Gallionella sp.]
MAALAEEAPAAPEMEQGVLRFEIVRFVLDGAKLLTQAEVDAAVAPYVGKHKDFSDVQHALEAIEDAYAKRGYSAVSVLLPEQELEQGTVHFRAVESRFGKVEVKDNRYFSEANVLNALPSLRSGGVPRSKQIAQELKLANENPARQLNAVLKAGDRDDEVNANVIVTDNDPTVWGLSLDNSGSTETGFTRLGISYRHANLFDADHVGSIQYVTSPQHPDRMKVVGLSYKAPLYEYGDSVEFFGGYSNVNALVGGLSNFQGGGLLLSLRYNFLLERIGRFDPRISLGLDRRNFKRIELSGTPSTILYDEIVVWPVSLAYAAQGKFEKSDVNFNISYLANMPGAEKGKEVDFAGYDRINTDAFGNTLPDYVPKANYRVARYGASYARAVGDSGGQLRAALNGQWSRDVLIQGEQIRLGGADGVRGFSEGSEGGESGTRLNLEGYTPDFGRGNLGLRAVLFYDMGWAKPVNGETVSVKSAGAGLRASYTEQLSLRLDWAQIRQIENPSMGQTQQVGDWRWHASLNASY